MFKLQVFRASKSSSTNTRFNGRTCNNTFEAFAREVGAAKSEEIKKI